MEAEKSPTKLRILQMVAGVIAIILSGIILSSYNAAADFIVLILAITLLVIGLERIGIGVIVKSMPRKSRIASVGLGIIAVILAIVSMVYPGHVISAIFIILAVALLIIGISRLVVGITYKGTSKMSKTGKIAVGVLSIIVGIMIIASPVFGFFLVTLILGVTLLINGIEIIISGVTGKVERRLTSY